MKIKGAELIIRILLEKGVDTVFGYPGGAVLNIYVMNCTSQRPNQAIHHLRAGRFHA